MAGSPYDKESVDSIYEFSLKLVGKSLADVADLPLGLENIRNKGNLGTLVEKYFFKHTPPNTAAPDFPDAPLELKTAGVTQDKKNRFRAKERLVLTDINYNRIKGENWEHSTLLNKCQIMLLLFYLYEKEKPVVDRSFVINPLLVTFGMEENNSRISMPHIRISESDLAVIQADWEKIKAKIVANKSHELSEGDTFFLGACRGGAGGEKEPGRIQDGTAGVKSRRFALKASFISALIEHGAQDYPSLRNSPMESIEDATNRYFKRFVGRSVDDISSQLGYFRKGKNHKGFYKNLADRMLISEGMELAELRKAGVELKTIRLTKTSRARESMSFNTIDVKEILEESWEDSDYFRKLESKFLFAIFKEFEDGIERLWKVAYWNMPQSDIDQARKVWERTKAIIDVDPSNLPKMKDDFIAHVRPKARNGQKTERTSAGIPFVTQCFWLNGRYITEVVKGLP